MGAIGGGGFLDGGDGFFDGGDGEGTILGFGSSGGFGLGLAPPNAAAVAATELPLTPFPLLPPFVEMLVSGDGGG